MGSDQDGNESCKIGMGRERQDKTKPEVMDGNEKMRTLIWSEKVQDVIGKLIH